MWWYPQCIHSLQNKTAAIPMYVAVPTVHSIQYKAAAVPTSVAVPTVQSGGNAHRELTKLAITHSTLIILYAASMQWPVVQQIQQHILIHVFIIHTNAIKADQNFSRQDISIIYRLSEVRKDSYLLVAKIARLV